MIPACWLSVPAVMAEDYVRHDQYPFSLELPANWLPNLPAISAQLRRETEKSCGDLYKQFSRRGDYPCSRIPYLISFESRHSSPTRCILMVARFPPTKGDYLETLEEDMDAKLKFGMDRGIVARLLKREKIAAGALHGLRLDTESKDGSHAIMVLLFDPDMPYQAVELIVMGKETSIAEDDAAVGHILKTLKLDFSLRVKLGAEDCVLTGNCQRFLMVTERLQGDSGQTILIVQDPHWDADAQWALCQGLRVLFYDNPRLAGKSAFLLEGKSAWTALDASPLTAWAPSPLPETVKMVLGTFLINGPIAFEWIGGTSIPMFGTEQKEFYEKSADLWLSKKEDAWTATVALRNRQIAASVIEARRKYDNPMLFVGGMHLLAVEAETFRSVSGELAGLAGGADRRNRGVAEWLRDANVGYVYLEPAPSFECSEDPKLLARYRALMAAEREGTTAQYVARLAGELSGKAPAATPEPRPGGTTVAPDPVAAAAFLSAVAAQQSDDGEGDEDKGGEDKKPKDEDGKDKKPKDKSPGKKAAPGKKKEPVQRYKDPVSQADLGGKNKQQGERAIRDADPNLKKETDDKGRTEWKDPKTNTVRVRHDSKGAHEDAHWDKYAPDGTPVDNAGRPVPRNSDGSFNRSGHIPAN